MKKYKLTVKGQDYDVMIKSLTAEEVVADVNNVEHVVTIRDIETVGIPAGAFGGIVASTVSMSSPTTNTAIAQTSMSGVKSPIPGQIKTIFVKAGDNVQEGQKLLILEAMKLENEINSTKTGVIKKIHVTEGVTVIQDQLLVEFA